MAAAVALIAIALVVVPLPARACACGGFVGSEASPVKVSDERAAISWDGTTERIVMSLSALSETDEAALLIPTPTPASVALADEGVFQALDEVIAPEIDVDYYWWPRDEDGAAVGGSEPGSVRVLETMDLGPVEVSVLDASNPDDLAAWLDEHGYVMGDSMASAVGPYVTEGWFYVAVRLTAPDAIDGELPPLDIAFESTTLVYPMRMSAAARSDQHVRTYVFAEQRMTRSDPTAGSSPVDVRFAGAPDPTQIENETLLELLDDGPYLTVMDQSFYRPGAQIVSDFTFERSGNGGDYREVVVVERLRTILGIPAGPFVLGAGLFAGVGLAVVLVVRRTSRRTAQQRLAVPVSPVVPEV